jgi:hypothetical protein
VTDSAPDGKRCSNMTVPFPLLARIMLLLTVHGGGPDACSSTGTDRSTHRQITTSGLVRTLVGSERGGGVEGASAGEIDHMRGDVHAGGTFDPLQSR